MGRRRPTWICAKRRGGGILSRRRFLPHHPGLPVASFVVQPFCFDAKALRAVLAIGLVLAACRRPSEAPTAPPPPDVSQAALPQAAPKPVETKPKAVDTPAEDPALGWQPTDAQWPAQQAVDVLVLAPAPALDPAAVDEALRPVIPVLRSLPRVERVLTRATLGQGRLLVRFAAGTPPGQAADGVRRTWQTQPPRGFATPVVAPIARGARARIALQVLADAGRPEATRLAETLAPSLLGHNPHASRVHLAGTVRTAALVDVLAPALRQNDLDLLQVSTAVHKACAQAEPDPGATLAPLRKALTTVQVSRHRAPGAQALPARSAADLVAVTRATSEPVREARNGQLPVTVLLADGGDQTDDAVIAKGEGALRREAAQPGRLSAGVQVHPAALAAAYRFVLQLRPERTPEGLTDLSNRLQAVRQIPEITGMLAIQGHDGVPEALDVDARGGSAWTVWVVAPAAEVEVVLGHVREKLSDGPWQAHLLSPHLDTGMAWLLGAWATSGALASAPDAARLPEAIGSAAKLLASLSSTRELRTGPQRRPATQRQDRLDRLKASEAGIDAQTLDLALDLMAGRVLVGRCPPGPGSHGVAAWLGLPTGDLSARQGELPLRYAGYDDSREAVARVWTLAEVVRLPEREPVLDRLLVDGRSALWVAADSGGELPHAFALTFWDSIERSIELGGGLQVDPLLLDARRLGAPAAGGSQ